MWNEAQPATVLRINISPGGLPKRPIECAKITSLGIVGDYQKNRKYHGGPAQALLLIASEVIDAMCAEGWAVFYGALGENVTTRGLDHRSFRCGKRYRIGSATIQLTKPRVPCASLKPYGLGIGKRIYDKRVKMLDPASVHWGESGFYASVIDAGEIRTDDVIEVL